MNNCDNTRLFDSSWREEFIKMEAISSVATTPQESTPLKENTREVNDDYKEQFAAGKSQTIDQCQPYHEDSLK